jgi:hypothetical protein
MRRVASLLRVIVSTLNGFGRALLVVVGTVFVLVPIAVFGSTGLTFVFDSGCADVDCGESFRTGAVVTFMALPLLPIGAFLILRGWDPTALVRGLLRACLLSAAAVAAAAGAVFAGIAVSDLARGRFEGTLEWGAVSAWWFGSLALSVAALRVLGPFRR